MKIKTDKNGIIIEPIEAKTGQKIKARIVVDLYDLIDIDNTSGGIEGLNDYASDHILANSVLTDISYKPVGVTKDGGVIIEVRGVAEEY